uniref:DZF domain-containing protein n=1 Tax=Caenorhabditis tropicalis TaxID=1561998 RepID=A0A1I7UP26_9PELO
MLHPIVQTAINIVRTRDFEPKTPGVTKGTTVVQEGPCKEQLDDALLKLVNQAVIEEREVERGKRQDGTKVAKQLFKD